jgi:hopanoid biosynthesis associated protein HpnK
MNRLIVTADDFGLAREVNEAIEAAHREGILTAASLMMGAPATEDAVARARDNPSLRVGLHLVLVDGAPLLGAAAVPDLVDAEGRFRANMAVAGIAIFVSHRARAQLAAEIEAQFKAFRATGLALDHVNAHKHFHLHPTIGRLVVEMARRYGAAGVRVPYEPRAIVAAVEPGARASASAPAPWTALLRRRVAMAGLMAPDRVFGLAWSGAMNGERLLALIAHLPDGLSEIYCHPATGAYPGSAPGYRYAEELAALCASDVIAAMRDPSLRSGGYSDFTPRESGAEAAPAPWRTEPDRRTRP